eukprot:4464060-Pyramimonas_sp.AAC.1
MRDPPSFHRPRPSTVGALRTVMSSLLHCSVPSSISCAIIMAPLQTVIGDMPPNDTVPSETRPPS